MPAMAVGWFDKETHSLSTMFLRKPSFGQVCSGKDCFLPELWYATLSWTEIRYNTDGRLRPLEADFQG